MKQYLLTFFLGLFFISASSQVIINEYSTSNLTGYLDNYDKTEDWIELYNTSSSTVDLSGYFLSDKQSNPTKWEIPSGTTISGNGYLVFWCSGRDELSDGNLHTNFKLKQTRTAPEHVILSDMSGTIINEFELFKTQLEHSYGRVSNGSETWGIFTNPTLGTANTGTSYSAYAQKPEMSLEAGFHSGSQSVTITTTEPNSDIYYTTNGYFPNSGSTMYTGAINVSNTQIVKAIVMSDNPDILPSFIEFNTYFINESHTLPIISSSANQMTTLLNGDINLRPHGTIEYFDADGVRQDHGYGEYNKHGQDSWQFPQRSFDYIARDEMGYHEAIKQRLMNLSDRDSYQKIIVRASGDDNYPGIDSSAHMRDVFIHKLANKNGLNVDMRRGERCVVYANGQYWGVYSIREKVSDSDYTDYYYDQDKYNTQYLMNWAYTWAQYGGDQAFYDWDEIHDFAMTNDLSVQSNYDHVADEIDVTSLVDYVLINSYVVCTDWINWNTSWWRGLSPDGSHKKWGYVLWDEDATFNHYINYTNVPNENADADPCYPEGIDLDPEEHIVLLNRLLDNAEFTQYYVTRYMDLMNTAFAEEEMISVLESIENSITPEMPQHFARWGGNMEQWQANVQKIKDFIQDRNIFLPDGLNECYDLTGPYDITLQVEPANTGNIEFNSLTINNDEFPWTGSYHGGVEMLIKAIPENSGLVFDHWEIDNHVIPDINAIDISLLLTQNDIITAVFAPASASDIIINEINYNAANEFETEDWVELYNNGDTAVDISNWVFKDSDDAHEFIIPDGTIMQPDTYLVLVQTLTAFQAFHPTVSPVLGDFDFGLSGGGELIRLFDDVGTLIDSVDYDDNDPWPVEADGNGPTLELLNPDFDNSLAASWQACTQEGENLGSPGAANNECTLSIDEFDVDNTSVYLFPNPMKTETTILLSRNVPSFSLNVYDLIGREVFHTDVNSNRYVFKKNSLNAGTYFLNIKISEEGSIQTKKLIIE